MNTNIFVATIKACIDKPDEYGFIDADMFTGYSRFAIMLETPYYDFDKWFTPEILREYCEGIVCPNDPVLGTESPVVKFCRENHITCKVYDNNMNLKNRIWFYKGCIFLNCADSLISMPKMLLVYVPPNMTDVDFSGINDCIIGMSTNTVAFKSDVERGCLKNHGTTCYTRPTFSDRFAGLRMDRRVAVSG